MLSSILPSLRILRTLVRSSTATVTNVSSSSTPSPIFWMTRMPNHQSLFNSSSSSSSLLSSFWDKFLLPPFTTVPPQLRLGFELESVSSSNPSWLPKRANDDETNNHNPLDSSEEGNNTSTTTTKNSLIEALTTGIWFAVPKRKKSYARKRQRQMSHVYASHNLSVSIPCGGNPWREDSFILLLGDTKRMVVGYAMEK